MPFIEVKTAKKLKSDIKLAIKAGIGASISLIPGKAEEKLMMCIRDAEPLYFRGEERDNCAFVEVRLKDKAELADKQNLTVAIYDVLEQKAGIAKDDVYLCFLEFDNWGSRGVLK